MNLDEIKKLLEKELQKYKKDKTSFKPYTECMKELNSWLKEIKNQ